MLSSAFIFASTNTDQICFASSEHFKKYRYGEQRALRKFSGRSRSLFIEKKRFAPSNLADTVPPIPTADSQLNCLLFAMM